MSCLWQLKNSRYAVLKKVGEDSKGTIYKARDSILDRVVAIKLLKDPLIEGEAPLFFLAETQVVGRLNHPNIVAIHDLGKEESKHFVVLEFVEGDSLASICEAYPAGKCDIQLVLKIAIDVCRGLLYAHQQGVLHQEINPENILVTADGSAKLAGFFLARTLSHPIMGSEGKLVAPGRVAMGLAEVDNLLLGGIPKNHSIILASPSCEKRDIVVRKFLETGAQSKEIVFYVTIDPTESKNLIEDFQANLRVFICNSKADTIIENLPNVFKIRGVENLTAIDIALGSAFKKLEAKPGDSRRACIEIISDVLLQHHAVITRRWLSGLLPEFASKNFVTLGVINPQMHSPEEVEAVVGLFKGELNISQKVTEMGPECFFSVKRLYSQEQLERELHAVAYLAPEVALGKSPDPRSDLYSLGATLYEALAGRPLFSSADPAVTLLSQIREIPIPVGRFNPKIPASLADCVMKLVEKEPEKRYQTASDLLTEMQEIAKEFTEEISTRPAKSSVQLPFCSQSAKRESPLVDRVEDLQILREAIHRATGGTGSLVFVKGEAGIGKTRLIRDAITYAQLRGMRVLKGNYPTVFSTSGVTPYVLWKEVIKEFVADSTLEQLRGAIGPYPSEIAKLFPEITLKLGPVPGSMPISPEHEQTRLFEAISQFIANISREMPLLIILDDLQWADQSSLLFLKYMAASIYKESILILGAYRDTDIDEKHQLAPILLQLNKEELVQNISLKRMTFEATNDLIKQILEQNDLPEGFSHLIHEKTKGNPFFVKEVIRSLQEEMTIYREGNRWKTKIISNIDFPDSVRSAVKSRIERCDDECQNVLVTASIIGERFTFETLREAVKIEEAKLFEIMEKILKTGLINSQILHGEEAYSFADVVVRDILNGEVSYLRQKRIHNTVGFALEKLYGNKIEQHFGDLAYHFLEGDNEERARYYFLKAGEYAESAYAHNEAFSSFRQALDIRRAEVDNLPEGARLTEKLGDIKFEVGEPAVCMDYWRKSLKLFTSLDDRKSVARLNGKMAHLLWEITGDRKEAAQHHQMALDILEKEPESEELATLYEDFARRIWRSGNHAEALPWAQKALSLALKLNAPETIARSYASIGALSTLSGDYDNGEKYLEKGAEVAISSNCIASLRIYQNLANVYFGKGSFSQSFESAEKGFELAKKVGDVSWIAWNGYNLAALYVFMGEIQKAFALFEEVLALDKKTRNLTQVANIMSNLGHCYCILGDWDKSFQCLTKAIELSEKLGDYQVSAYANQWIGELHVEMKNFEEAEKYIGEANNLCEKAGDTQQQVSETLPALTMLYYKEGKIAKAKGFIDRIREYSVKSNSGIDVADADLLCGILLREQGNLEDSKKQFEDGLRRYESVNAQRWYVKKYSELLYEFGLTYLVRNGKGDKECAYVLLDRSLEIQKRIGARKRIEEITAKKKMLFY